MCCYWSCNLLWGLVQSLPLTFPAACLSLSASVSAGCVAAASHAHQTAVFQMRCKVTSSSQSAQTPSAHIHSLCQAMLRRKLPETRNQWQAAQAGCWWESLQSYTLLSLRQQETRERAPLTQNWNLRRWRWSCCFCQLYSLLYLSKDYSERKGNSAKNASWQLIQPVEKLWFIFKWTEDFFYYRLNHWGNHLYFRYGTFSV